MTKIKRDQSIWAIDLNIDEASIFRKAILQGTHTVTGVTGQPPGEAHVFHWPRAHSAVFFQP